MKPLKFVLVCLFLLPSPFNAQTDADHEINLKLSDASHMMALSTLRPEWNELRRMKQLGVEAWIQEQRHLPLSYVSPQLAKWSLLIEDIDRIEEDIDQTNYLLFQVARWQTTLTARDQLRQRVAFALSEIFWTSDQVDFQTIAGYELADYYDIFLKHALGNYKDLWKDIRLHPVMGNLLVHYRHPIAGPYISRQLIQRLITPNPSPDYVLRVATVFNDNGEGIRGDLGAVIQAILTDVSAIENMDYDLNVNPALLREPLFRYTRFCEEVQDIPLDKISEFLYSKKGSHAVTDTESVFSASLYGLPSPNHPGNALTEEIEEYSPEFSRKLDNRAISFVKEVQDWTHENMPSLGNDWESEQLMAKASEEEKNAATPQLDLLEVLAVDPLQLLEELNALILEDQLSAESQDKILKIISDLEDREQRVSMALYLLFLSPEYVYAN